MSMNQVVAGWYPDPDGRPSDRYWNGQMWTEQTRPRPAMGQPYGTPYGTPQGSPYGSPYGSQMGTSGDYFPNGTMKPFSAAAVWSCIPFVWGIVGLICAIVALTSTAPTGDRRGRGAAVVGLCINIAWIIFFVIAAAGGAFDSGY